MAGVLKSGRTTTARGGGSTSAFNFDDMTAKANAYLETVKLQAAQIIERAHQQATQIHIQAEAKGKQSALEAAKKTVHAEFDLKVATLLPALQQAIQAIHEAKQVWIERWENAAIGLAVAISERLVRRELSANPEISSEWIREALELGTSGGRIRLLLNPDDYRTFEGKSEQVLKELGRLAPAEIVADPTVSRGGCRIVTEAGEIDQTLEAQLKRIEQELKL